MFKSIISYFKNLLLQDSYSQRLEKYIASKGVQTAADVDYWVRQYEKKGVAPFF